MSSIFSFFRVVAVIGSVVSFGSALQTLSQAAPKNSRASAARGDDAQNYRNAEFGFSYKVPFGWVDRTGQLGASQANGDGTPDSSSGRTPSGTAGRTAKAISAAKQAGVLLGVFERPPEATADSVNSGVVIAYEGTASYPGLKKAEDYVGPLTEVAIARGFKVVGEPYSVEVESRILLRVDFVKSLTVKAQTPETTMRQSTLVLISGKRILSFTFIAANEDGLDEIMDGLHFFSPKASPR